MGDGYWRMRCRAGSELVREVRWTERSDITHEAVVGKGVEGGCVYVGILKSARRNVVGDAEEGLV